MNNCYNYYDKIIGLKFVVDRYNQENYKASNYYYPNNQDMEGFYHSSFSGERSLSYTNLINHLVYNEKKEIGDFNSSTNGSNIKLNLSYLQPFARDEIRADIIFDIHSDCSSEISDHYSATTERYNLNSQDNYHSFYNYKQDYNVNSKTNTFETLLKFTYRSNQNNNPIRHQQDFWNAGLGLGYFSGDICYGYSDITKDLQKFENDSLTVNLYEEISITDQKKMMEIFQDSDLKLLQKTIHISMNIYVLAMEQV